MFPRRDNNVNQEIAWNYLQIKELEAFGAIGTVFNYLGRECVITGHREYSPYVGAVPTLFADYCDDTGQIRQLRFKHSELPSLIAQQKRTGTDEINVVAEGGKKPQKGN